MFLLLPQGVLFISCFLVWAPETELFQRKQREDKDFLILVGQLFSKNEGQMEEPVVAAPQNYWKEASVASK